MRRGKLEMGGMDRVDCLEVNRESFQSRVTRTAPVDIGCTLR